MNDLEVAAHKFKEWKGDRRYYRYPPHFWEQIIQFTKHYSIDVIAKTYGINIGYLRSKLTDNSKSITFKPLEVTSSQYPISIEFLDHKSHPITVRMQANQNDILQIISCLTEIRK